MYCDVGWIHCCVAADGRLANGTAPPKLYAAGFSWWGIIDGTLQFLRENDNGHNYYQYQNLKEKACCISRKIYEKLSTKNMIALKGNAALKWKETSTIDHMHMTSQKGAPVVLGVKRGTPRAPSPSMHSEGKPLHASPPSWPGCAH